MIFKKRYLIVANEQFREAWIIYELSRLIDI